MRKNLLRALPTLLLSLFICSQTGTPGQKPKQAPTPLVLATDQGEQRMFRTRPGTSFTIKVDPKNGGSEHFVLITEVMPPGDTIPTHRHPNADELLILQSGTAKVKLGDRVQEALAGAIIFIPRDTWIGVENIGKESVILIGVFSAPGFEEYMRAISVPAGEKISPLSPTELEQLRKSHPHDVIYE
jgi:quercetin dioxygenase-like cupin family protein